MEPMAQPVVATVARGQLAGGAIDSFVTLAHDQTNKLILDLRVWNLEERRRKRGISDATTPCVGDDGTWGDVDVLVDGHGATPHRHLSI